MKYISFEVRLVCSDGETHISLTANSLSPVASNILRNETCAFFPFHYYFKGFVLFFFVEALDVTDIP